MSQAELPLTFNNKVVLADPAVIVTKTSLLSALNYCVSSAAGLDEKHPDSQDRKELKNKQIYGALSLDKGHWTRIKDGQAHLAANLYNPLMQVCGNYAPLQYLAWSNGFDLVKRKSRLEQELEAANRLLEEERLKTRILTEALTGKSQ